jgi:hypothetical protein
MTSPTSAERGSSSSNDIEIEAGNSFALKTLLNETWPSAVVKRLRKIGERCTELTGTTLCRQPKSEIGLIDQVD